MRRFASVALAMLICSACFNYEDDCKLNGECVSGGAGGAASSSSAAGSGGAAGEGGNGGDGGGGEGGHEPCDGACSEATPLCDETNDTCVECLGHTDCTNPEAAKCEVGACVPCTESAQCAGHAGAEVCKEGTCVECALGEEAACDSGSTCNLIDHGCVDVAPGSVSNCEACSNDLQCADGHHCIPMDFDGSPHGYFCLQEATPTCERPFPIAISKTSISGAAATNHCGIEQDLTTCEAVLALMNDWQCSATDGTGDGKCSPDGIQPEVAVPGAICREVGVTGPHCTYECGTQSECPSTGGGKTCGGSPTPTWCGG